LNWLREIGVEYLGNVKFGMKAKFTGDMPDFGVNPITKRAYSSQISREHK
jgi:hypothetical protein